MEWTAVFKHFQQNVLTALRTVRKGQGKKAGDQLGGYCNSPGERENESELMQSLEKEETCEMGVEWFRLPTDSV